MNKLHYYIGNIFRRKYRFVMQDESSENELWYMSMSLIRFFLLWGLIIIIFFVMVALTTVFTPILDQLPGYPGSKSREMLVSNIMKIDSMEHRMVILTSYINNHSMILGGETPPLRVMRPLLRYGSKEFIPLAPSREDSVLRVQLTGGGSYQLLAHGGNIFSNQDNFVPPITGVVVERFDPPQKRFGVTLEVTDNQPVTAIANGTIIFSEWSPELGNIIQIQHSNNLVATYKNVSHILKDVGGVVSAGEVVGYTGKSEENLINFEMWRGGVAVDPESYIGFLR